jgi:hypothetical protein
MKLDAGIKKIFNNRKLCLKSGEDVNSGQYIVFYPQDTNLIITRKSNGIYYPCYTLYKRINHIDFTIEPYSDDDTRFIYDQYPKLLNFTYRVEKIIEKKGLEW